MDNNSSSTNTILIVVVLIILVALGVWWFMGKDAAPAEETGGIDINATLPAGEGNVPAPNQ